MPVGVFTTNGAYVRALRRLDTAADAAPFLSVSSFISSVYFPASSIARFFRGHDGAEEIVRDLLARQAHVRDCDCERREIYEARALRDLVVRGEPHEQEVGFHVFPKELFSTLRAMAEALESDRPVEIGITREVVPMVFCANRNRVLIDVRMNYPYQTIQGLRVEDDAEAHAAFVSEFERLWSAPTTITDQAEIRERIELSLSDWESGELADKRWPPMAQPRRG